MKRFSRMTSFIITVILMAITISVAAVGADDSDIAEKVKNYAEQVIVIIQDKADDIINR